MREREPSALPPESAPLSGGADSTPLDDDQQELFDEGAEYADDDSTEDEQPAELPAYLAPLLGLPGVSEADFEGVDPRTAFIELQDSRAKSDALPIGHLAPNAVETLQALGFRGHVRAAIKHRKTDREAVGFFAFQLPAQEEKDGREPQAVPANSPVRLPDEISLLLGEFREERRQMQAELERAQAEAAQARESGGIEGFVAMIEKLAEMRKKFAPLAKLLGMGEGGARAVAEAAEDDGEGSLTELIVAKIAEAVTDNPRVREKLGDTAADLLDNLWGEEAEAEAG